MTTTADRKFELLKIIAANPGIEPGVLLSRSVTCNKQEAFTEALKGLTTDDALVVRVGMGANTRYHLTDRGAAAAEEYGFEVVAGAVNALTYEKPVSAPTPLEAMFDSLPEITAGADEAVHEAKICEPLPVIDSDRLQLDEALAQLGELVADINRPINLIDLIEFNRRGAAMIRAKAPVPAALMESSANALERAYCQQ